MLLKPFIHYVLRLPRELHVGDDVRSVVPEPSLQELVRQPEVEVDDHHIQELAQQELGEIPLQKNQSLFSVGTFRKER